MALSVQWDKGNTSPFKWSWINFALAWPDRLRGRKAPKIVQVTDQTLRFPFMACTCTEIRNVSHRMSYVTTCKLFASAWLVNLDGSGGKREVTSKTARIILDLQPQFCKGILKILVSIAM